MNTLSINTSSELNTIKIVSFPKLGEVILRFYLSKTEKKFSILNEKLKELDLRINKVKMPIDSISNKDVVEFEELYHLINYFYLFLGDMDIHRYYNLRCIVGDTLNLTKNIKNKISALQEFVDIDDNILFTESKVVSMSALNSEWNTPEEDKIWNEYFASI